LFGKERTLSCQSPCCDIFSAILQAYFCTQTVLQQPALLHFTSFCATSDVLCICHSRCSFFQS
jgi:hypothetical protein